MRKPWINKVIWFDLIWFAFASYTSTQNPDALNFFFPIITPAIFTTGMHVFQSAWQLQYTWLTCDADKKIITSKICLEANKSNAFAILRKGHHCKSSNLNVPWKTWTEITKGIFHPCPGAHVNLSHLSSFMQGPYFSAKGILGLPKTKSLWEHWRSVIGERNNRWYNSTKPSTLNNNARRPYNLGG